ncbi:carbamoyltransferase C-terminal domain-containing protein [Cryobacterium luteum]|uniref:Uncharacterized protein n=1 Tax=Cryobacterium luteum TaxID=1424661 RepID=A0A1H8L8E2_9MICO|nr:carbamoyltransferase C-terminal domain-containing protein [Cryobacterium luteum]TFB94443.1 hypothetical protein E3O10_01325 [Cryobacterium luteum]SEO01383.1 carbamoyltransferase [Cryobacterium luteum]
MTLVLGIHCGHEASCAVVEDGILLAAIQQERVTREKYDGQECLSNRLPVRETLAAAGRSLDEVDVIVSEFQAVGVAGVGLQRPLFTADFDLFDPFDSRHWVVSHHLAHAASTVFASGFSTATVLVSDSAGSTTESGEDFAIPFAEFYALCTADVVDVAVITEMRSIYAFTDHALRLVSRDFVSPHNQPDVHVQSEASLFDNVARYLFRSEHSHGQLMALAGLPYEGAARVPISSVITSSAEPRLRNGWQQFQSHADPVLDADVADVVQKAFTELVVFQASRAVALTGFAHLACAGGVFLNLNANSAVAEMPEVDEFYVPSSPHDAGIAVGAAFLGWWQIPHGDRITDAARHSFPVQAVQSDFFGAEASDIDEESLKAIGYALIGGSRLCPDELLARTVDALALGKVVARFAGRSEFGPRALGNRSLLCHPLRTDSAKDKLNTIKHRQRWRPVAPMVREEDLARYFTGPPRSAFMNFNYKIRPEFLSDLREAAHSDGTARVQTVTTTTNPAMHELLTALEARGEMPVLLNTSLNGPGQPILEDADAVLDFARHPLIDHVLTRTSLVDCRLRAPSVRVERAEGAVLAVFGRGKRARHVVSGSTGTVTIPESLFLELLSGEPAGVDRQTTGVREALSSGLLVEHP